MRVRWSLHLALLAIFLGVIGLAMIGGYLAAPRLHSVGHPPTDLPAKPVDIQRQDGKNIAGWLVTGESDKPGILLLHGIRSDRRQMIARAKFLLVAGYSVLLIDMQGHGESPGENITFGFRESNDVRESLSYLRTRVRGRKVGIIGVSLGGAATLLGISPANADALVIESVYSSIEKAVENRISIRIGKFGEYLAPLLTWQIEPRLGIPLEALSPVKAIKNLSAPVMIISGTEDRHTQTEETLRLYEQAPEPKQLWLINGAKHQDLHLHSKADYERKVLEFLRLHLSGSNDADG